MDIRTLREQEEKKLDKVLEEQGDWKHPHTRKFRRWRASSTIRSGHKMVEFKQPRQRTRTVWQLCGSGKSVSRFICMPRTAERVPGRVNHAVLPLKFWWNDGLGRRSLKMWNIMRRIKGSDGRKKPVSSRHALQRDVMRMGWTNYIDNLQEMQFVDFRPRLGEFHLYAARVYWRMLPETKGRLEKSPKFGKAKF